MNRGRDEIAEKEDDTVVGHIRSEFQCTGGVRESVQESLRWEQVTLGGCCEAED